MRSVIALAALAVFVIGTLAVLALLAADILPPGFFSNPLYLWLTVLALGGSLLLFVLLNSGLSVNSRARPFIFDRGTTRRGRLALNAGAIDFNVSAHAADMAEILAGGQAAGGHTPRLRLEGGDATLSFPRRPLPLMGEAMSDVTLSPNVPWVLDVRSGLGQLDLDLYALNVPNLEVRSGWGDVRVITPSSGVTTAALSTWLGDASIEIPEGVAARINSRPGRFAEVTVDEQRWQRVEKGTWVSPGFEENADQLTLNLNTSFGSISVS